MRVAICCNDHRNGQFTGKFDTLRIDRKCEFEIDGHAITVRPLLNGKVRISRRHFAFRGWTEWVGNWCWDELDIVQPVRLLLYLHKLGWRTNVAECTVSELWGSTPPSQQRKGKLAAALRKMLTTEGE